MTDWIIPTALFVGGAVLATFQWLLKSWVDHLKDSMARLQASQEQIDKEVRIIKETYVQKVDLKDIKEEILQRLERRLERIENHLMDNKNV